MPHPADIYAGKKLREFRLIRGLTQANVAAELGLSFQQLQKYETGHNRISISRAEEVAKVIGFDPAHLFRTEEDGNRTPITSERGTELARIYENLPDRHQNAVWGFMKSLKQGEVA